MAAEKMKKGQKRTERKGKRYEDFKIVKAMQIENALINDFLRV